MMSSGSGTIRGMPASAVVGGGGVIRVGTGPGKMVGVVVDTVQTGRRT